MHCTGCSNRLEKVLNNVEGVEKATVSFAEKEATITYNEETNEMATRRYDDAGDVRKCESPDFRCRSE